MQAEIENQFKDSALEKGEGIAYLQLNKHALGKLVESLDPNAIIFKKWEADVAAV